MDGNQQFEIGPNAEETATKLGIFAILSKSAMPWPIKLLVSVILGAAFLILAFIFIPFLSTFFPDMDLSQIGQGIFVILTLILVLAINSRT